MISSFINSPTLSSSKTVDFLTATILPHSPLTTSAKHPPQTEAFYRFLQLFWSEYHSILYRVFNTIVFSTESSRLSHLRSLMVSEDRFGPHFLADPGQKRDEILAFDLVPIIVSNSEGIRYSNLSTVPLTRTWNGDFCWKRFQYK